jgi:WD40 repeat protein
MTRLLSALALSALVAGVVPAAPVPEVPADPTKDREGNPLPKGATARLGSMMYRGPMSGLTFSADGKRLLARDETNRLFVYDADTGKPLPTNTAQPPELDRFVKAGGRVTSVVTADRVVWLAQAPFRLPFPSEVVVCGLDGKVLSRFDVEGQVSFNPEVFRDGFGGAAVSGDGRYLATLVGGDQPAVVAHDLATGGRLLSRPLDKKDGPSVALSRDGGTLFVKRTGGPIRRFGLPGGKELPPLEGTDHEVWQAQASPGGKWVVTGKFRTRTEVGGKVEDKDVTHLEVRAGDTGRLVGKLEVGGRAQHVAFVGPDALVVSAERPRPPGMPLTALSRWNLSDLKREWEAPGTGLRVAAAPDGKTFAAAAYLQAVIHDAGTGKPRAPTPGHTRGVEWVGFSPDGRAVSTAGGGEVITWGTGGELKRRVSVPELNAVTTVFLGGPPAGDHLVGPGFAEDERRTPVVVGWDREKAAVGWRLPVADPPSGWVVSWAASPDGRRVLTARPGPAGQEVVTVRDGPTGEKVSEWSYPRGRLPTPNPPPRALSGDGRVLAVLTDETVLVRDAATGKEEGRVDLVPGKPRAASGPSIDLAASRDGSRVAVLDRGVAVVYDVKSGKPVGQHTFPDPWPGHLTFSPDGTSMAVRYTRGSLRGQTLFVWEPGKGPAGLRALGAGAGSGVLCAAFSPDGKSLAVGYSDGTALVWDLTAK